VLQDLAENFVYLHRTTLGAYGASELALIHPSALMEERAPKLAGDQEVLSKSSAFEPLYPLIEAVQALVYVVQAFPYPFPELVLSHPSLLCALLATPEAATTPLVVPLASLAATAAALSSAALFPISTPVHSAVPPSRFDDSPCWYDRAPLTQT
jgi:hypothetical protein